MRKLLISLALAAAAGGAGASWYWPFGDDKSKSERRRVSELMEPVSAILDEASDFADDGKIEEAVEAYKRALAELDRIEAENPGRVKSAEFATVRNKRAYIDASIDSLLMKQVSENAKAVTVTDTTELERKYQRLKEAERLSEDEQMAIAEKKVEEVEEHREVELARASAAAGKAAAEPSAERKALEAEAAKAPGNRRVLLRLAAACLRERDFDAATEISLRLLDERPNDSAALNMRAAAEAERGDLRAAESTLAQCIQSNPANHYAFYNMARLVLKTRGEKGRDAARGYYEAGRKAGGPVNAALEEQLR